ncbi:hypothetical protein JTE90_006705 [Oedothorax gibbosus]|uniref:Uncharacterized protein n=1 Tax=Oedothorax gibbosus TaxID=931172 RepID=A0AAV6THW6_9ARAC|nr:hypothetical protein JTE90_006705 [Oedothorax gibbosus]
MASKGGKPLDMKQTPEFIRHNPPNNRADFCIPLDEMIDKFSKHKTSPTAKYLLDTCEKLKDFMSTYTKYQLSLLTQNTIIGEFFAPPILKLFAECSKMS